MSVSVCVWWVGRGGGIYPADYCTLNWQRKVKKKKKKKKSKNCIKHMLTMVSND